MSEMKTSILSTIEEKFESFKSMSFEKKLMWGAIIYFGYQFLKGDKKDEFTEKLKKYITLENGIIAAFVYFIFFNKKKESK